MYGIILINFPEPPLSPQELKKQESVNSNQRVSHDEVGCFFSTGLKVVPGKRFLGFLSKTYHPLAQSMGAP